MPFILIIMVYLTLPAACGLVVIARHYYKVSLYKKSTYYKITHNEYEYTMSDAGRCGEYFLFKELSSLEKEGARFLFNLYLPRENDNTTEIDMLMFFRGEIFVFENKNYGGWIFGKTSDVYWTQSLKRGRRSQKERFYNPIKQNTTHIKYLKKILGDTCKINSVIVFSDRAVLKKIDGIDAGAIITQTRYVMSYVKTKPYFVTADNTEKMYQLLYPYSQVSEEVKSKHISNLRANRSTNINVSGFSNNVPWSVDGIGASIGLFSKGNIADQKETEKDNKEKKSKKFFVIAIACTSILVISIPLMVFIGINKKSFMASSANQSFATESQSVPTKELDPFAYTYQDYIYRLIEIENSIRDFIKVCEEKEYKLTEEECNIYLEEFEGYSDEIDNMLEGFDEYNSTTEDWNINQRGVLNSYRNNIVGKAILSIEYVESDSIKYASRINSNILYATGSIHSQIEFISYWGIRYDIEEVDGKVVVESIYE